MADTEMNGVDDSNSPAYEDAANLRHRATECTCRWLSDGQ